MAQAYLSSLALHVYHFLKEKKLLDKPLLLALSMGVDSLCLFHLLLEMKRLKGQNFSVAHVNHNWRESSQQEALKIMAYTEQFGILCYTHHLDPKNLKGNLENSSREARYAYFTELCKEKNLEAVLLAHQKDDQVETIIKRLFEGHYSRGIKADYQKGSLRLLRPLLPFSKEDLDKYLKDRQLSPIYDSCNDDEHFLRPRMRKKLIPLLEESFGKGITNNLLALATECQELESWIDEQLKKPPQLIESCKEGSLHYWDKGSLYLFKQYLKRLWPQANREFLAQVSKALIERKPSFVVPWSEHTLYIDRGWVFITNKVLSYWHIYPCSLLTHKLSPQKGEGSWQDFLMGRLSFPFIDLENYEICSFSYLSLSILEEKKWKLSFSKAKIPNWLWPYLPFARRKKRGVEPLFQPFMRPSSIQGSLPLAQLKDVKFLHKNLKSR